MRKLGYSLSIVGAVGMLFAMVFFASDYQPSWRRAILSLPDRQDSFTHQEVSAALFHYANRTQTDFYYVAMCSAIQIVGAIFLCFGKVKHDKPDA